MLKRFYILLVFCSAFLSANTQQDSLVALYDTLPLEVTSINKDLLEKYKNDPTFDYAITEEQRTWFDDLKSWLVMIVSRLFEGIFGMQKAAGALLFFLRMLPYLLVGLLVFLLIKFFYKLNINPFLKEKSSRGRVHLSDEEQLIRHENLQELINKAMADKAYRLAVRYYYLSVLKSMSEKNLILWQPEKTNTDYVDELATTDLRYSFSKLTKVYDHYWYGQFPIDAVSFTSAARTFQSFERQLGAHV